MFTGIVRDLGRVASFDGARLVVDTEIEAGLGDSVSINGACLTVVANDRGLSFDVVSETLVRTTLGELVAGDAVNLEPALRAGEPLGGHIVQGHVDAVGHVRNVGEPVWVDVSADVLRYCVEKGSIAVDGVSLTIAALDDTGFAVALVPHTLAVTTLGRAIPGTPVNLEIDVVAKYVERLTMGR